MTRTRWRLALLAGMASCFSARCLAGPDEAEVAARLARMRTELDATFLVQREGLFLVAGNLPRAQFDSFRRHTIGAASESLWRSLFAKRPDHPITVYLFADDASYRDGAKRLFGDTDVSHFGYYKPSSHTLVMNIGTGGGTLVHEMTHALMAPDFPNAPAWFSEALGSLYEQCQVGLSSLRGLVNWRLPALQKAIDAGQLIPLAKLVATTDAEFRGQNVGLHYAEARYLALYLQEKGLLPRFYRAFRDKFEDDPTGAKPLAAVTGLALPALEKEWVAWVKTLRFPER